MISYIAILLAACTSTPSVDLPPRPTGPSVPAPPLGMEVKGSSPVFQLDHMPAAYTLPNDSLPPGFNAGDTYKLEFEPFTPKRMKPGVFAWRAKLETAKVIGANKGTPPSVGVLIRGKSVPYSGTRISVVTGDTWRYNNPHIILSTSEPLEPGDLAVSDPAAAARIDRLSYGRSGLSEEQFVHVDHMINDVTRHGLLLPAPAAAEWEITVPAGKATFETHLALDRLAVAQLRSDGADAVLSVIGADGNPVEAGRHAISADSESFEQWRVDLSKWAGQPVKLRLSTDPKANNVHDYVFAGSPTVWGTPSGDVRRVVVIGMDTTRPDRFSYYGYSRPTSPDMDRIAYQSVVFQHAWTPAPRTRPSFRAATTGRYPLDAVGATNIGEVFRRNGFATAGVVANVHLQPRFDFDDGFDFWHYSGGANAEDEVDTALSWFKDNASRDTYMFLHFMDPHVVYRAPGSYRAMFADPEADAALPEVVSRSQVYGWMNKGTLTDAEKDVLRARYDGEIAYMSSEIGRLVTELDKLPGKTLIVFHNDHGDEHWEHGAFEHNHTLYNEVTSALLWIRPPGGLPRDFVVDTPATLMDIGPTLYDLLGFTDLPTTDGLSLAPLMQGKGADDPKWQRPLGIGHVQYGVEQWGVVYQGHKFYTYTGSGVELLFKMDGVQPEGDDLSGTTDLAPYRKALVDAHPGLVYEPGYRVRFQLTPGVPLTVTLPKPAKLIALMDPEANIENRANLPWGEKPRRTVDDVAKLELSADKQSFTLSPSTSPSGIVIVYFDTELPAEGVSAKQGDSDVPFSPEGQHLKGKLGRTELSVEPGYVPIAAPGEHVRMMQVQGGGEIDAGAENTQMLCHLGYLEGAVCEGLPAGEPGQPGEGEDGEE